MAVSSGKSSNLPAQFSAWPIAANPGLLSKPLSFNEEGNIEVEDIHWPTNQVGVSNISDGWNVDGNCVIEGEISETDSLIELNPTFDSVIIMKKVVAGTRLPTPRLLTA